MELNKLTIEEAHRIVGELFFAFKMLEKDFRSLEKINEKLSEGQEELKCEIFSLKKQLVKETMNVQKDILPILPKE